MKYYIEWARKEYSLKQRLLATSFAGIVFAILLPVGLILIVPLLDSVFHVEKISFGVINFLTGFVLIGIGGFFALWSISDQLFKAGGSPIPMLATQNLLITGPFKLCRNPMVLGALSAYLGIGILIGSVSVILCVLAFAILLLLYIKKIEEKELEIRFGMDYLTYKAKTPFIIPRIFVKKP